MPNKLIIAAHSVRAYAQAANVCGYKVVTLDAFADADTRRFAAQFFQIQFDKQGVDANDFKRVFSKIDLNEVQGFLYGSLFDAQPDLLAWVAARVPLVGNTPETLQKSKSVDFFKLLNDLAIPHPLTHFERLDCIAEYNELWLSKRLGGTGGTHVRQATQARTGDYYQLKVAGEPVSLLFVADGVCAQAIGFNRQLVAPTMDLPYRFAGAVSNLILPKAAQQSFMHTAQQLTTAFGLRGINSLDAILHGETLWILELNPRLSATFNLYSNLLPVHIQGCSGVLSELPDNPLAKAELIIFADEDLTVPANFDWPNWVADIPYVKTATSGVNISLNVPICSVLAEAETADLAHQLVIQRAEVLKRKLLKEEMARKGNE
ncbi:MAG: ATP-grasp domain-containing protein [Methylotenera sp.]|uniref:ATP-grasp domain-containing protein n=1 Tax=Methylotenera sp. TaxID=2051956 RepID=UPI0017CD7BD3|nr:ATP-grasp domain-containing protein [Methylotenera sp.]NOU26032.1 ATP-grasp domain-containing protein [Methylotenera sp.]